jgi:hypothetical protein
MIGPGGLLLVVPHLFVVPVWVLSVGLQKSTELNLDVKNIFAGSHNEHRCLISPLATTESIVKIAFMEAWTSEFDMFQLIQ